MTHFFHPYHIWLYIWSIRFLEIGAPGNMEGRHKASEILLFEDIIYVALGTNVKECKSILLWAVQNSGGKNICILHVHQAPQLIPFSKSQNLYLYLYLYIYIYSACEVVNTYIITPTLSHTYIFVWICFMYTKHGSFMIIQCLML